MMLTVSMTVSHLYQNLEIVNYVYVLLTKLNQYNVSNFLPPIIIWLSFQAE